MKVIIIILNKNNSHVIALIIFYKHRKTTLFKVLGSVIYSCIVKYICLYYLCLHPDKLSLNYNSFQNSVFDDISGIIIPEVLRNIMYCRVFSI